MKAIQRFVKYNSHDLLPLEDGNPSNNLREKISMFPRVSIGILRSSEKGRKRIQNLATVFWDAALPIFRSGVEQHLNISDRDHELFLIATQMVMQASIRISGSDNFSPHDWTRPKDRYMAAYVYQHRFHLPRDFVSTLKMAFEKNVVDIPRMLVTPPMPAMAESLEPSMFWSALTDPTYTSSGAGAQRLIRLSMSPLLLSE
jgi:hypothetical protein